MRLGIVNHHGQEPGGAERTLLLLLAALPSAVKPFFFLFEEGAFTDMLRRRYDSVTLIPMSRRIASNTRTKLRFHTLWDAFLLSKKTADLFRREKIDVVLTNSMKAHVVGSLAAKMSGLPCVNYLHDAPTGSARTVIRTISRFCAEERLTCSNAVDKHLGLPRTTAVYSPIQIEDYACMPSRANARAALGLPNDDLPIIGLIGRILRWKGQDRFIRIAARVLRERDAHFAIVGGPVFGCEPEYPQELQDLVIREGLQKRMHFVPWQNDPRNLLNAYAAIDIACNCSVQEPFGRTSLEALACGVPVVCFNDAGVCEIFEHGCGGMHVPAGDETAFAEALDMYLDDAALISKARGDALEAARRLDVKHTAQRFIDVISRVGALAEQGNPAHA